MEKTKKTRAWDDVSGKTFLVDEKGNIYDDKNCGIGTRETGDMIITSTNEIFFHNNPHNPPIQYKNAYTESNITNKLKELRN